MSSSTIKSFGTVLRNNPKVELMAKKFSNVTPINTENITDSFDGMKQWREFLPPIINQEACGNCWAVSTLYVLSSRIALITNGKLKIVFSTTTLTACGYSYLKDIRQLANGNPDKLWKMAHKDPKIIFKLQEMITREISCSGQSIYDACLELYLYGAVSEKCVPAKGIDYYGKPYNLPKATKPSEIPWCLAISGPDFDTCADHTTAARRYRVSNIYNISPRKEDIQNEILHWGPVVTGFMVFDDFINDYDGKSIYTHPKRNTLPLGGHAVVILGWGIAQQDGRTISYWLIANSWGSSWGLNGYFRMEMFLPDCTLEQNVIGFIPDLDHFNKEKINTKIDTWEQNIRSGKIFKEHQIDPITGYYTSAIKKIKDGKLKGELTPLIDPSILPDFYSYRAMNRYSKATVFNTFNNKLMYYIILSVLLVIVIVIISRKLFY